MGRKICFVSEAPVGAGLLDFHFGEGGFFQLEMEVLYSVGGVVRGLGFSFTRGGIYCVL